MNKIPINVPEYVEFISQWEGFSLPTGHNIIDKTICGCGFTEYCLRNTLPTILCSPRKVLLENKEKQHNYIKNENGEYVLNPASEYPVYYFKNDGGLEYDVEKTAKDTTIDLDLINKLLDDSKNSKEDEEYKKYLLTLKTKLVYYINNSSKAPKILVTYDSLHHVLDTLDYMGISEKFYIVVDEFQSIFMDSVFKANVELDFVEDLKPRDNVLYLSATPLDEDLDDIDYFKDLTFYKLIWPPSRVDSVRIRRKIVRSIFNEVNKYIENYRSGKFINKVISDQVYQSKELVIFCNSVKTICDIVKRNKLKPDECNILCSNAAYNVSRLKKLGHQIGEVPLEGEPHKMFTFCTRTTYLGADFYSTCAYTIICSDCNIETLAVDISLDLPQIVGRQRLKNNVFRNEVLFLYRADSKKDSILYASKSDFDALEEQRDNKSATLLSLYNKGTDEEKKEFSKKIERDSELYIHDFIGISRRTGKATYNYLVKKASRRAWKVTREDYQNEVKIKHGIESAGLVVENTSVDDDDLGKIEACFEKDFSLCENDFVSKMKVFCDYCEKYPELRNQYWDGQSISVIPLSFQNYINLLGPKRIKALKYQEGNILNEIKNISLGDKLKSVLIVKFIKGKKYFLKDVKNTLREVYESLGSTKTPKATDLEDFFTVRYLTVVDQETGHRGRGLEIVEIK